METLQSLRRSFSKRPEGSLVSPWMQGGVSQDGLGSSPVPGELGGTGTNTPHCDFASLSLPKELLTLPKELLTPDYSIPETTDAMLILGEFYTIGMQPQEPWGAAGMALPPSQAAACEKRGKKRGQSALPKPDSKRRALAGSTRLAGGEVEPEQG
ncbi:proline-rich protein 22-like [Grus japonensis]|uniref:Proline-rich protein 22-like n=1 Tax=Grus japonensis TaxID=30415 RepID=A0ABC9YCG1_GRUJA